MSEINTLRVTDADVVKRVKNAVRIEIEKRKTMNLPIAVYDAKTGKIYAENSDGSKREIGSRITRGGYSEHIGNQA